MPHKITAFRVFIATPQGLEEERDHFRTVLQEFNEREGFKRGVVMVPVGWESVAGGVGRPQTMINAELESCDYLVLVLHRRWGSPTYTDRADPSSGTEEEFKIASDCLRDRDRDMRDILVMFRAVDDASMSDPGDQLSKVLEFKRRLEESKEILFHTYDDLNGFSKLLQQRVAHWVLEQDNPKEPRSLGSIPEAIPTTEMRDWLDEAQTLASSGRHTDAEAAFARAIQNNDVDALTAYGTYLRRSDRSTHALQILQRLEDHVASLSDPTDVILAQATRSRVDRAIIHRANGDLSESTELLESAITATESLGEAGLPVLVYALDNAASTFRKVPDLSAASRCAQRALELRRDHPDLPLGSMGYSYSNLGRINRRLGELRTAEQNFRDAIDSFNISNDQRGKAQALADLGTVLEARAEYDQALESFQESFELNSAENSARGKSMNLSQIARVQMQLGDLDAARYTAQECLKTSEEAGSAEGVAAAHLALGRIALVNNRSAEAADHLRIAGQGYEQTGNLASAGWSSYYLAEALAQMGDLHGAREAVLQARAIAAKSGDADLVRRSSDLDSTLPRP